MIETNHAINSLVDIQTSSHYYRTVVSYSILRVFPPNCVSALPSKLRKQDEYHKSCHNIICTIPIIWGRAEASCTLFQPNSTPTIASLHLANWQPYQCEPNQHSRAVNHSIGTCHSIVHIMWCRSLVPFNSLNMWNGVRGGEKHSLSVCVDDVCKGAVSQTSYFFWARLRRSF